jgi:hypothetical protein
MRKGKFTMRTTIKQAFLAAILCTLAVPALAWNTAHNKATGSAIMSTSAQQTEGEAANLEKKETGVDAEEHPVRQDNARKVTPANRHTTRVAAAHRSTRPKAAVVQRAATQQHSTAKLKTGQLTTGQAAKLQTKQTTLHREVRQDREDNSGPMAGEKNKVNQQNKTSNEIHQKKHNARMF